MDPHQLCQTRYSATVANPFVEITPMKLDVGQLQRPASIHCKIPISAQLNISIKLQLPSAMLALQIVTSKFFHLSIYLWKFNSILQIRCEEETECYICSSGYALDNKYFCKKCSDFIPNCQSCYYGDDEGTNYSLNPVELAAIDNATLITKNIILRCD